MDNSILLPVQKPVITGWTWVAALFSILQNNPASFNWIYSNYINVYCLHDSGHNDKILFMDYFPCDLHCFFDCPYVYGQALTRRTIRSVHEDIRIFFINALKSGNYIYGIFDEGKLFHTSKFRHELFIYGYNEEADTFSVADFTLTPGYPKYGYKKYPSEAVCQAYHSIEESEDYLWDRKGGLLLVQARENGLYDFDAVLVKKSLMEYLSGYNSFYNYRMRMKPYTDKEYGVDVYAMISNNIKSSVTGESLLDVRVLHNLYDHKVLMLNRMEYMIANRYLAMPPGILNEFESIKQKVDILWCMALKARINDTQSNKDAVKKMNRLLFDIKGKEISLLEEVIKKINL